MPRAFIVIVLAVLLAGCTLSVKSRPTDTPSATPAEGTYQNQLVNNQFVLKHVDERLTQLSASPRRQLQYLALYGCATQMTILGVFSPAPPGPLLDRSNALNRRYNRIYASLKQTGNASGVPYALSIAMDDICLGDHPLG